MPEIVSAQRIIPAAGSLDSAENGLWNYYRGKSRSTVKRNAPMYERIGSSKSWLLDDTKIRGVDLYLPAGYSATVREGDRVYAGQTVIAAKNVDGGAGHE